MMTHEPAVHVPTVPPQVPHAQVRPGDSQGDPLAGAVAGQAGGWVAHCQVWGVSGRGGTPLQGSWQVQRRSP